MTISCGSSVYVQNKPVGRVRGIIVDGIADRVQSLLVRYNGDAGGCYVLPFEGILDSDETGVHTYPAVATLDFVDEQMCDEERERLHHWVQSLTTADPDSRPDWENHYAAFDERDRGTFAVVGSAVVQTDECGCGVLALVEVDRSGFIERVGLSTAPDRREVVMMRPLAKRSRRELIGQGHQAMQYK